MDDRAVLNWYLTQRADDLVKKLNKRGFNAQYAATAAEAKEKVLALIPQGSSVILTGSQTLEQIGVKPHLRESGLYRLINPYEAGISREEGLSRRKRGLTAEVMVSSTNAVTEEGMLVNVDAYGNRVAGMIFGPDKVVLAIGMNKVVKNLDQAWERLRSVARPMNAKRLELPTPCAKTGFCEDCSTPSRICNYFTIIERCSPPGRIQVVLVGEVLGY
ncbi:MAG: lactate utilization protein [Thermodesulfobacteriota bacterium]